MGLDARPFQAGLTKAQRAAMTFQQGLNTLGMGVGILGLIALTSKVKDTAAELKRVGEATGLTVEQIQALGFAASQNGSDTETMNKALEKLTVNLGLVAAGDTEAIEKFEQFGISVKDANGNLLGAEQVLGRIADKIQDAAPNERAAIAYETLGKSGVKLVQTLADGSEGLAQLKRLAEETGQIVSTSANDAIVELTDTLNRHLGQALNTSVAALGGFLVKIKEIAAFLGTLAGGGDFAAAGQAALDVVAGDQAERNIQRQVRQLDKLGPILDKIAKHEKERAQGLESSTQKIQRLKDEERDLLDILKDKAESEIKSDLRLANVKLKLLDKQQEMQKAIADQKARETQLQERSIQLQGQLAAQQRTLTQSKQDRSLFTLEELAGYNLNGFGSADVLEDARKARQVLALQTQAESARFDFGNVERSRELFGQADAIRKTISNLKSTERPFANMEEGIKSMKEQIAALNEKAAGEGIILKKVVLQ